MTSKVVDGVERRVELLAPAGGPSALHAAVAAGADAVYLGLDAFNARRNAENFTLDTLAQACDYAHLRNVRVYVTLNTLVLPSEIDRAIEVASRAANAGADAFIVQDIGVASRLKEQVPEANLHISTQMNTHSIAGLEAAALLGARRVTLARELSMGEIEQLADVAAQLGMQVETFAHGALCVCYSGQCLMSSLIGGRSANRGLCAQACRLSYDLHAESNPDPLPAPGEHLLSPQDLCTIDVLPQLVRAGVSSLKIEGRMKSPEYVFAVVGVYRCVLDRVLAGEVSAKATDQERRTLSEAFSRGFTTAYLEGHRGNDIMSYGRPNNRGVFAGRVSRVGDGWVAIASEVRLVPGDVIEFWTNKGHFAHVLDQTARFEKNTVFVQPERAVGKGDRVFRVRSAEARFVDDPFSPRVAVVGKVQLRLGEPARVEFSPCEPRVAGKVVGHAEGSVVEVARTKALTEDEVREHVDRLGQTPFCLESLEIDLDDGVGMGFSQLHRLRTAALDALSDLLITANRADSRATHATHIAYPLQPACSADNDVPFVAVWATNPACARAAKRAGAQAVYVPALNYKRGEASCQGVRLSQAGQAGYPKRAIIALPVVNHDPVPGTREERLGFDAWRYVKPGKPVFADSLGDLVRAHDEGALPELGFHVPVTNRAALQAAATLGAHRVWLSPELTLGQLDDMARGATVPLGIVVVGAQELMITEHCPLMSQGPCNERCNECPRREVHHHLTDRKGFDFPVVSDALGRGHLYNGVSLDIVHTLPDLIDMGISAFMVDSTLMTPEETAKATSRAVRALDAALHGGAAFPKPRGATTGHLFRGVM
ncbi:DUF3656 domain-containing protein [Adlercreutzia sp. ZJ138]|uniref:DUF3656 domain-containing U32 family peptidase n=1 Tax=Adlercreutzia sp. ZJ138 TaxID=2709405 RepID=UPI0013EB6218|nr:DUF3656 domain-containing protein [Adlercreutzia sp. ZJ138]